ncbi:type II toxin-antitoxin system PemK/MazF family toxin [Pantoea sp. Al-1710]|uniref:Type II toxin-antitoxin system PemK/MazF family toxin n=1 Tax=Candidatus Pantoea communis TaxID=2608354 RepID=A0ABX0RIB9_9GAMM|nr:MULTISPECIES: type II toxin-antitoxin system PemK/MazF family toxin [Pantoea]NIG12943.1 type II toxin-antitoxin system PemK/MazF family toxin [Pantoea sp. Cy-640]NIG17356.1 type II toxin-antitoxin system PemK/MazF family toxin [Pantoea communis]
MVTRKSPARGQIWHVDPNPVFGHELKDPHYFIVITDGDLNRALKVAMCCPISTGAQSARSFGVTVNVLPHDTDNGNLRGVVLCHQLKAIDLISRGATYYTQADEALVNEVISKIINIIDPQI